ncbi:MAG: copper-binding protein, partial [Planctomycetes bacterium]|nr:copper-binding protein [Planctomycetota bacterium]
NGCTILDLIWFCADDAENHVQFVSCVVQLTKNLKKQGIITGRQRGAIQRCAARADIP